MRHTRYSFHKSLPGTSFEEAVERAKKALKKEGFGVLTSIDVQSTLREKLNVDTRPYVILGACNPQLAHQALQKDDTIGLLLPCNVVVTATEHGAEVAILRPSALFSLVDDEAIRPLAEEVEKRMERILEAL